LSVFFSRCSAVVAVATSIRFMASKATAAWRPLRVWLAPTSASSAGGRSVGFGQLVAVSFRKTGTTEMLAYQADILVCVQASGALIQVPGVSPVKNFETVYPKSYKLVHFVRKMVRNAVHNVFLNT